MANKKFTTLSQSEQIQELKKMSKRANVRLALLEKENEQNTAYNLAKSFNEGLGRKKNRFFEGTKYNNQDDILNMYSVLSTFLNDSKSTLKGVKQETQKNMKNLLENSKFDYEKLKGMTEKEMKYASQYLSKVANRRLKKLEENNYKYHAYEQAEYYNKSIKRKNNRFYTGLKFENKKDLVKHLQNVGNFINKKGSTIKGVEETLNRTVKAFRKKGVEIKEGQEKEFIDFLSSEQFKAMSKYADSNQVIETWVNARNVNDDVEDINNAFNDFIDGNIYFDEVQERLNIAEWNGELLNYED